MKLKRVDIVLPDFICSVGIKDEYGNYYLTTHKDYVPLKAKTIEGAKKEAICMLKDMFKRNLKALDKM